VPLPGELPELRSDRRASLVLVELQRHRQRHAGGAERVEDVRPVLRIEPLDLVGLAAGAAHGVGFLPQHPPDGVLEDAAEGAGEPLRLGLGFRRGRGFGRRLVLADHVRGDHVHRREVLIPVRADRVHALFPEDVVRR
jgi:hypothetical protein